MDQRRKSAGTLPVLVIGAGPAGVVMARTLAERGLDVLVMEPDLPRPFADPARRGALYVKPAVDYSPEARFAHQAFMYAADYYSRLQSRHPETEFWQQTGTLQLAWNTKEASRQDKLVARNAYPDDFLQPVSRQDASQLSGLDLDCGGLWFPAGGHIRHSTLRTAALAHPRITTIEARASGEPAQSEESGNWRIATDTGEQLEAQTVICTTGAATADWFPGLPLGSVRGQITRLKTSAPTPRVTVSGAGYALPPQDGTQCVGATFDRGCHDAQVRDESHRLNLQNLRDWCPGLGTRFNTGDIMDGWVGFRSTTPDHMPIAGRWHGLFLIAGLGGKGLAYAPILARTVAESLLDGEPVLDGDLINRVSPARFS